MNRIVFVFVLLLVISFKLVSISEIDSLKHRLNDSITDTERLQTYYDLAKLTKRQSITEANQYIESALKISPRIANSPGKLEKLLILGDLYREKGDFLKSYRKYQNCLLLSDKLNSVDNKVRILIKIADFYYRIQEYNKALDACNKAEKFNLDKHNKLEADILFYKGFLHRNFKKYELSLKYMKEAQVIYYNLANHEEEIKVLISIGKTYFYLDDYDNAINYQLKAQSIAELSNDDWQLALTYNDLGWAYYKKDNFEESLKYNLKSLELRHKTGGIYAETSSLLNIGILYKNYKHYPEAIDYINRAWTIAKNFPESMLNNSKRRCSKNLYEIYEALGDNEEALENLKIYNDAIINFDDNSKKIELERLKATLRIESSEEKEIIKSNHYKQKMILVITIITGIGLLLLQILFSSYSKKKQQNSDLQFEIENRKQIESELKSSKDRLKLLNKILRHDLTNDIAVINSAINIYHRTPSEELLNVMQKRIKQIVGRISYYKTYESIIDSNTSLISIDINKLLNELALEYQELEISIEGYGNVLADETIDSVFVNLFKNAIKHGSATKVMVDISTTSNACKIEFSDNGKQIPDVVKEKIFQEGFIYGKTGHTGIGLFIVKSTLENYQGSINAIDNDMGGTTFVITLNLAL